ncbi:MAG: RrF2 family transcriptional regulator [Candidatus Faecivicinus sp.]
MMISTRGRYALRVMIDLAEQQAGAFIPLKEIAQRQELSEKYLESIVKALVKNGLLEGVRGKGGGYRLVQPPEACTVGSVLRLTEVGLAPVACLEDDAPPCPRANECRTLPMWRRLHSMLTDFFDGVTIADLMAEPNAQSIQPH